MRGEYGGMITGMVFGSLVMIAIFIFGVYWTHKKYSLVRLTKKIGRGAEIEINNDIAIWAKHTKNKFIRASLFKYDSNKVFEVDGILVTSKGIGVVEVKSIKGEIIGDGKEVNWTKKLGSVEHKISNPIIQNDKHIEHILKMTKIVVPIFSLIVFSNRAESIKVTNTGNHVVLIRHTDLYNSLDEIDRDLKTKLTPPQVASLTKKIKSFQTKKVEDIQLHKSITNQK